MIRNWKLVHNYAGSELQRVAHIDGDQCQIIGEWLYNNIPEIAVTNSKSFDNFIKKSLQLPQPHQRYPLPTHYPHWPPEWKESSKDSREGIKNQLYQQQDRKCNGCLREMYFDIMQIDHIVPKSKGGNDDIENLQLLCSTCNATKGSLPMEQFLQMPRIVHLRNQVLQQPNN